MMSPIGEERLVKRSTIIFFVVALASTVVAATATARATSRPNAPSLSSGPAVSRHEGAIIQAIETRFAVTGAQIAALRAKGLRYSEIFIVFSVAEQERGGVTPANVDHILALRQGPPAMGWKQVADVLAPKLSLVVAEAEP